uniref:Surfeit locus protein 2 n=1 Tax=Syphacia muris TaxID=451379 RepID=A0A0N5A7M9_9BILA
MDDLDDSTKAILKKYPVFEPAERGKVRCVVTGHELPPRLELLDAYIKTPKFIRAFRVKEIMDEYGGYFDDLGNNKFGCKLTKRIVSKDPDDLKRHVEGKKFKAALERAESGGEELDDESYDSDMSIDDNFPSQIAEDDSTFEDDDDEDDVEEEYPEFMGDKEGGVSDNDNDISAMDTENVNLRNRKRKAKNKTKNKKKRKE